MPISKENKKEVGGIKEKGKAMKRNMLLFFAIFSSNARLWSQTAIESEFQTYNEFKDKNIEFSLDDGENESKFHFEDQNLIDRRMKELEAKKALRNKQMKAQIAKEEALHQKLEMTALQEKNKKIHDQRQNKIRALKLQQEKIGSLFALNRFHQFPHESFIPTQHIVKSQKTDKAMSTIVTSASLNVLPQKAPQIMAKRTPNLKRSPAENSEGANQGLLQRAKNKIFDYFNRFKSFFQ